MLFELQASPRLRLKQLGHTRPRCTQAKRQAARTDGAPSSPLLPRQCPNGAHRTGDEPDYACTCPSGFGWGVNATWQVGCQECHPNATAVNNKCGWGREKREGPLLGTGM
jgi:hypothetical protein